mgnify:CR=1 FL=1
MTAACRIAASFPPRARLYALIRFGIIRSGILRPMHELLPRRGRVLEVGCGYGLFAAWFAARAPGRTVLGVGRDAGRVALANRMAQRLGVAARFEAVDARALPAGERFDAIYALDVLHHVPRAAHDALLRDLRDRLEPGGLLLVKEIDTRPAFGLAFTRAPDRVMAPRDELSYRGVDDWRATLARAGFSVEARRIPDLLPYPHVLLACRRL